jgi:hypothetical protein
MAIMHVFVQCPRLNCLVRHAITHPEDTAALVDAVTLAESLWQLEISEQVLPLLVESTTVNSAAPFEELADIVPDSLDYDSIQSMILCTRYWMLIIILGGFVDTLYRHFPTELELSLLPDRYVMHKAETEAAMQIARSIPWADSVSSSLPLVPLRLHTPVQISIGPWYRTIRRLTASNFHVRTAYETYTDFVLLPLGSACGKLKSKPQRHLRNGPYHLRSSTHESSHHRLLQRRPHAMGRQHRVRKAAARSPKHNGRRAHSRLATRASPLRSRRRRNGDEARLPEQNGVLPGALRSW